MDAPVVTVPVPELNMKSGEKLVIHYTYRDFEGSETVELVVDGQAYCPPRVTMNGVRLVYEDRQFWL